MDCGLWGAGVVRCVMLADDCMLVVVSCWLCVAGCALYVVCCWLFVNVVCRCLWFVVVACVVVYF